MSHASTRSVPTRSTPMRCTSTPSPSRGRRPARWAALVASTAIVALAGCETGSGGGPFGAGGEAEVELDHATAMAIAKADVKALMLHADLTLDYLDGVHILNDLLGRPALKEPECDEYGWCEEDYPDIEWKVAKEIDDIIEVLEERVMLEAHLQSGAKTELRYKIDPQSFCGGSSDNDCKRVLKDVPAVVRVTSPGPERLTARLLVSDHEVEIAALQLSASSATLTLSLDLDKAASAACKAAPLGCIGNVFKAVVKEAFNESDDLELETKDFGGQIVVTWTSNPTGADVTLESIGTVRYAYTYKGKPYSGSLGKTKVVVAAKSASKSVAVDAKIGRAELSVPYADGVEPFLTCLQWDEWGDWCEQEAEPKGKGAFKAVVDGVSVASTLTRGQKALVLTGISVGDATLSHDAVTVAKLAFKPAGAAMDLSIAMPDRDTMTWTAAKAISAAGTLALSDLAVDVELESFIRDEALSGEVQAGTELTLGDGFAVSAGNLKLSSTPTGAGEPFEMTAKAGQCIEPVDGEVDGVGLVGLIEAGPCQ
jgi:hypothetical protein